MLFKSKGGSSGGGGDGDYVPLSGATRNITADTTQLLLDKVIYTDSAGNIEITMIDPNTPDADGVYIRCMTGSVSFNATLGTVETSNLSVGQAVFLAPRASDNSWREV